MSMIIYFILQVQCEYIKKKETLGGKASLSQFEY
jgi:hypothetical protein